jgi:hypothetical protein
MAVNFNKALGRMVGIGGDYFISALTTPTSGLLFSHILITSDAVVTDIKIGSVSVKTARHYSGTIPTGYLMCAGVNSAGADLTFNYVMLASGSAEGVIFEV